MLKPQKSHSHTLYISAMLQVKELTWERACAAVELATVSMVDGKLQYKILDDATVDAVLKELDLAQPAAEAP